MSRMQPPASAQPNRSRLRRWLIVVAALGLVLAAYGWGLSWVAQRLGDDMQRTVQGQSDGDGKR